MCMFVHVSTPFLCQTFFHRPMFNSSLPTRCLVAILKVRLSIRRHLRNRSTIPALFAQTVSLHPHKAALIYEATGEVRTQRRMTNECSVTELDGLATFPSSFESRFGVSRSCRIDATLWLTGRWPRGGPREMWWPCTWRAIPWWWLYGWVWL